MATAAATTPVTTYPHIVKTPGVRGGKACIDGTRICVKDIVVLDSWGYRPEQMLEHFSSRPLTLAEVYAALAYYHDHKDEIDAAFEEDKNWETEYEADKAAYLSRRSSS